MFGKNPVRKQRLDPSGNLRVQEVFQTIQGEGPFSGCPAVFVRLAGCNLRCHFCDTDFESGWENVMAPKDLAAAVMRKVWESGIKLIVITGGEPLLQNLEPFLSLVTLMPPYCKVQIETAGTVWPDGLEGYPFYDDLDLVVSPKTVQITPIVRTKAKAWKYIIREGEVDPNDGLPLASTQVLGKVSRLARPDDYHLRWQRDSIFLQPCDEPDPAKTKHNIQAAIDSCMKYGYRLCLQQHKLVGLP